MQNVFVFLSWWVGQLSGLVPAPLKVASGSLSDAVIIERHPHNLNLLVRTQGQLQRLAQSHGGEAGVRELATVLRSRTDLPRLLVLHLSSHIVLRKDLALPIAARRSLADVIGFEIDRETPFQRDEVHWTY